MTVGERIKALMEKKHISQNRLAREAQISQSGLSSIVNGAVSPKEDTLTRIAAALGVAVTDLLTDEKKRARPIGRTPNAKRVPSYSVVTSGDSAGAGFCTRADSSSFSNRFSS